MELTKLRNKKSEAGLIPEDWQVLNLGKSSLLKARIGWQGLTTAEYLKTGDFYLVTGTDFKNGFIDWDNCVFVLKERFDQDKFIQLKINDILVTKDGTIGKVAFINKILNPTTLNSGVFVIRPTRNEYESAYLYHILMSKHFDNFLNKLTAGSTISHLYQKDFIHYDFPAPKNISEQKVIATALSDVDDLINNLEKLIAKKKAIKQGAMQQLLTPPKKGGKRLVGFTGIWEYTNFESLCKIFTKQTGFDYSAYIKPSLLQKPENDALPFIQNKDFENKWFNFQTDYYIPKEIAIRFPKILLDEKCFLISISGSIGKVGVFQNERLAFIGGAIAIAKFKEKSLLDWTLHYLNSNEGQNKLFGNVKSGSHQNLILDDIRKIMIPIPSKEERDIITTFLDDIDDDLINLELKRSKLLNVKKGMMQELLTGKTRLV